MSFYLLPVSLITASSTPPPVHQSIYPSMGPFIDQPTQMSSSCAAAKRSHHHSKGMRACGHTSLHPDQQWLNTLCCVFEQYTSVMCAMIDGDICCWVNTTLLKWSGSWSLARKQYVGAGTAGMHCLKTCTLVKGLSSFPVLLLWSYHAEKYIFIQWWSETIQ